MNLQHERIANLCGQLKLDRVALEWGPLAQRVATEDASLADFLERLLNTEVAAREERKRQVLTKLATLPSVRTLEQYDFGFASGAPRMQIQELGSLAFYRARRERCAARAVRRRQDTSGDGAGLSRDAGWHQEPLPDGG